MLSSIVARRRSSRTVAAKDRSQGEKSQCKDGRRGQTQTSVGCLAGKTQTIKMQRIENKLRLGWASNGDESQHILLQQFGVW